MSKILLLAVVRMPLVLNKSLLAYGIPHKKGFSPGEFMNSSASLAFFKASSSDTVTKLFKSLSKFFIRDKKYFVSSTDETILLSNKARNSFKVLYSKPDIFKNILNKIEHN